MTTYLSGPVVIVDDATGIDSEEMVGPTDWTDLVLTAPWTAVGGLTLGWRLDGTGNVQLRGIVATGVAGNPIATLPAGARPARLLIMPIGITNLTAGQYQVQIDTTGVITARGTGDSQTFDGVVFSTI